LMKLAMNQDASEQVRAVSFYKIKELKDYLDKKTAGKEMEKAHIIHALSMIDQFMDDPNEWKNSMPKNMPDGSPIGMDACGGQH